MRRRRRSDEAWRVCLRDGSSYPCLGEIVTFDDEGQRTAEIDDEDCDGEPNGRGCTCFIRYESGRLVAQERDGDCDGVPDWCSTPRY